MALGSAATPGIHPPHATQTDSQTDPGKTEAVMTHAIVNSMT